MSEAAKQREFTGWHMLGVIVLFFGVIIAVNLYMAFSAVGTWTGLVVENSYVASQEFNTKLAIAREREAAGWDGGLSYEGGELVFSLTGADGEAIDLSAVNVAVSRPIGVEGDQDLVLSLAEDGTHRVAVTLEPGVWNAKIAAGVPGEADYEHNARLIVGD